MPGHHLKSGQTQGQTLQPQQLMQLQAAGLTFSKQQPPFTPIQLKPQTAQQLPQPSSSKSKNKKRTTPTPPKP